MAGPTDFGDDALRALMASPIEVKVILCDAAASDATSGKVHMLGAGWSVTGTPTGPQAVAILMKIPWGRANQQIPVKLQLFDSDGNQVRVTTPAGENDIMMTGHVEVGRPPGVAPGSLLDSSLVLNVPPLPLPPGRYQWRLDIADQTFTETFEVRTR
jgi:hypothetical protein